MPAQGNAGLMLVLVRNDSSLWGSVMSTAEIVPFAAHYCQKVALPIWDSSEIPTGIGEERWPPSETVPLSATLVPLPAMAGKPSRRPN